MLQVSIVYTIPIHGLEFPPISNGYSIFSSCILRLQCFNHLHPIYGVVVVQGDQLGLETSDWWWHSNWSANSFTFLMGVNWTVFGGRMTSWAINWGELTGRKFFSVWSCTIIISRLQPRVTSPHRGACTLFRLKDHSFFQSTAGAVGRIKRWARCCICSATFLNHPREHISGQRRSECISCR